ncbi:MAG: redoxin domain-containing protein [Verrucomicrobiales bacterium]|nr:redoxin domain-containing protein [Verrucomicrobiales bacterium]
MIFRASSVLPLLLAASCVLSVRGAQEAAGVPSGPVHGPEPAPGHSIYGEAFDEGPRTAATLMKGMPAVHFRVTSTNPAVQPFFDQGVGQLHGFWYFEAERSFRQVARLDPECAMAYWGMAMANVNNPARARDFIARAMDLRARASAREGRWIQALADYRREKEGDTERPEKERRRQYVRALESLVQDDPEDVEARAFLVYQIWDNAGFGNERSLPISSHQAVDALLDGVFARSPMHPAHHYRIHLWDGEKPVRALESAAKGGPSGSGIAHLWHMPGHTYDKLHRYSDAAWQQEASARVDHAHMIRARILPDQIHNYAHNQEWLSRSLSHLGRVNDAAAVAGNLTELPRHPKWNHLGKGGTSSAYGRLRLATLLVRWELWDRAIAEAEGGRLESTDQREHEASRLFTLGFARLMKTGSTNELGPVLAELEKIRAATSLDRLKAADEAEAKARKEKKNRDEIGRAMSEAMLAYEKDTVPVDEALAELRGWLAIHEGNAEAAKEHFDTAGRMPKSRLAYAWLKVGKLDDAVKAAREAAEKATNQLHELAVRCDVLWQAGKTNEAIEAFGWVRAAAGEADPHLPILDRLRPVAEASGIAGEWRTPSPVPADIGTRPPLDTLGPRLWEPYTAPTWAFAKGDGGTLSSAEFAGHAHLLVFYLGHGCPHCIEQLKAFGPAAEDFASAGIPIVAISLDAPEDLPWTARRAGKDGKTPFPVVSDEKLTGFRAFGAFDDFEDRALHGTFLVDAAGKVRWQDIGPEPYTDVTFLLAEAKRLLRATKSFAADAGR